MVELECKATTTMSLPQKRLQRSFDKTTGAQFDLLGHAKAVHSLGVLQGVVTDVNRDWGY